MRKPEFIYVTYIETTPEKLWQALTDGDFTERYWFGVRLTSDWKAGSSFEMVRSDGTVSDAGKVVANHADALVVTLQNRPVRSTEIRTARAGSSWRRGPAGPVRLRSAAAVRAPAVARCPAG